MSDPLTVEDRFFLRIALKNRLLNPAQAEAAARAAAEQSSPIARAVRTLGLLDPRQIERVREAMAASQVMRLDALFGEILLEQRLATRAQLQQAFAEQRRQRYRARVGHILVQQRVIPPDVQRRVISEVIRRLRSQEQEQQQAPPPPRPADDLFGSSVEESRPLFDESVSEAIPLRDDSVSEELPRPDESVSGPIFGSTLENRSPLYEPSQERMAIPLDDTREAVPFSPFGGESSVFKDMAESYEPIEQGDLTQSAIAVDLVGEGFDLSADRALLESDLKDSVDRWAAGDLSQDQSGFVLEREDLEGDGFVAEEYVRRRRTRARLLAAALGATALAVVGVAGVLGSRVYGNQRQLDAVQQAVAEALADPDPAQRKQRLEAAASELSQVGSLGVRQRARTELREAIEWSLLEAEALGLLAANDPAGARQLLLDSREEAGEAHAAELEELLQRCERERRLSRARQAESKEDWGQAVHYYREAAKFGDPGAAASRALEGIRARLNERLQQALARARRSLSKRDEAEYAALAKLLQEHFTGPPDVQQVVADLAFRRASQRGLELARANRLPQAEEALREALRLRPGDAELTRALEAVSHKQRVRAHEVRGRKQEGAGRYEEAVASYRAAIDEGADSSTRRALEAAIERCRVKEGAAAQAAQRQRRFEGSLALLRQSKVRDALAELERLAEESKEARVIRLLDFARQVEGMAYVRPGEFLMGSPLGSQTPPSEQPRRRLNVPGFFVSRTEVTNAAYAEFVAAKGAPTPRHWTTPRRLPSGQVEGKTYAADLAKHPVVWVSWEEARAYARWRGGDLPSEAQWEKAARGPDAREYPWGEGRRLKNRPVRAHVHVDPTRLRRAPTSPVGAHGDDESPYGVYDMAGNVEEWVRDAFERYPGAPAGAEADPGKRVLRGGSFRWPWADARCARRSRADPAYRKDRIGFRIVIEVPEAVPELR